MSSNHYDIIIIGTGAGGGTLAYALASTGKRILMIERGGYLPREKDNWSSKAVFQDNKYKASEDWIDKNGDLLHPGIHYYVGGNTKVYGAALLRFRKQDFGEIKHHGGISPAWPISYEEIEPYYTKAEHLYQVHGEHGVDPTEPPASAPYSHPPVSHEPRIKEMFEDMKKAGHTPFYLPLGIRLNESDMPKSECIRCSTCDGFPCLVNAKSDAQVTCVDPALKNENVSLLLHALVTKLETDPSGREIRAVRVTRDGAQEIYSADIVVLSAGAVNSAALLLRSANDKHPNGLANGSDQLGRNYMFHNNSVLLALSTRPNTTVFQKTVGLNDYYLRSDDWDFPLGHIQMLGKSDGNMLSSDSPVPAPGFTFDLMAKHALDFWLTSEDLPDANNRVTLEKDGRVRLSYTTNNMEPHKRLVVKLKNIVSKLGMEHHLFPTSVYLGKAIPTAGTAHQCGTARFGKDPKTSVLDVNCKAHELDNLYVVDASCFLSSTAVNPGLTIMANALRVADHLKKRMGAAA